MKLTANGRTINITAPSATHYNIEGVGLCRKGDLRDMLFKVYKVKQLKVVTHG